MEDAEGNVRKAHGAISRRTLLQAAIVSGASLKTFAATAAEDSIAAFYRGRTLKLLIGAAEGGAYDAASRTFARHVGRYIPGAPNVIVQNMPGASGLIMLNYLYNLASKDGLALGMPTNAALLESRLKLFSKGGGATRFNPERMNWLGTTSRQPSVLFVWHTTPFHSLDDLRDHDAIFGATAAGSDNYIVPTLLNKLFGCKIKIITGYKGISDTFIALERGEIQGHAALLGNLTATKADWVREGKLRILLQFGNTRSIDLPNVPTALELVRDKADRDLLRFYSLKYDMAFPIASPEGIPPDRLAALRLAFDKTMADESYRQDAAKLGLSPEPVSAADLTSLIREVEETPQPVVDRLTGLLDGGTK